MKEQAASKWKRIDVRLAIYSLIFFLAFVFLFLLALHRVSNIEMSEKNLLGVDFADFYAAGKMVIMGDIEHVYDVPSHHAILEQVLGRPISLTLPWRYPPVFLLVVVPFAFLPFRLALVCWLFITLALALYSVYCMLPNRKILSALLLGFPGLYMNLLWGQNGFISAALLAIGVGFLENNPALSGAMFGLLFFKPQFAVFPLLILLLTKQWKALKFACCTALIAFFVCLAVFGPGTWLHFAQSLLGSSTNLLESGRGSIATILVTTYNALLILGTHSAFAILAQAAVSLATVFAVVWVWKKTSNLSLKGAILVLGIPLCIPYFMQYDLVILAVPLILLVYDCLEHGSTKLERGSLLLLWLLPLINWPLSTLTAVQIAPVALIALVIMIINRVRKGNEKIQLI